VVAVTVVPQPPDPLEPDALDAERRAAQARLEVAVGEGRLTLDEFTERAGRVWGAGSPAELQRTLSDLPVPVVGQTASARSTLISVIGDIRRRGRWALRRRTTAWLLIGDVELDLRGALIGDDDVIEIGVNGLIGDVEIVVPEGVEAELTGFTLIGDRRVELAPVPRVPGTPRIRVRVFSVIGDAKLRSAG
jgi:hypothetical protein